MRGDSLHEKKFFVFIICFFCFLILCSCGENNQISEDFVEGSLLFDMGAKSTEDIEYCKIIDDGPIPEIFIDDEEFDLFVKYRYKSDYPFDKLHELLLFPENKRIDICIEGNVFALYLMDDGNIGVQTLKGEAFKIYYADKNDRITPKKYDVLVNKYCQ
jgi:hypothetical protein